MSVSKPVSARASRIRELLEKDVPFEDLAVSLASESDVELLQQLALPRQVDRATFDLLFTGNSEDGDEKFAALLGAGKLQPLSQQPHLYNLRDRSALMGRWKILLDPSSGVMKGEDAELFRELSRQLAEFFASRGEGWQLDHLYHLLAAEPAAGLERTEALLKLLLPQPEEATLGALPATCEGARDGIALGQAFDIVDLVRGQLHLLPASETSRYKAARRLVETWSDCSDAWYRTRRYIPRQRVHGFFTELLADSGRRILELSAPGGSGKTMSLRWLIAHHCIPRRRPIAHLDFDRFLGKKPELWQLLLRCAEQLDRQIAGAPFETLVRDGLELERSWASRIDGAGQIDEARLKSFGKDFPSRFGNVLSTVAREPVTIVVDTFEEAMIRDFTPVPAFVAMLVRLVQTCSLLRLVISGRYGLEHREFGKSLEQEFPQEFQFFEANRRRERFPQFDEAEARIYFCRRGIALGAEQWAKLFAGAASSIGDASSGGREVLEVTPFYLALVADLIENRGGGTESVDDLLQSLDQVKLIYLVERVIARIDDIGVRWLLRYGVVPRRLTRDFYHEVILEHLKRVHLGRSEGDDPGQDKLPAALQEKSLFFNESQLVHEGRDLWNQLRFFASSDSWVEEREGGEALSFHPYVRDPMRSLLQEHRVLREIHHSASRYFEEKGLKASDAKERIASLREEIYHLFQWQGKAAGARLSELFDRFADAEDFASTLGLAKEIWSEDYRPPGAEPLIGAATLKKAQICSFHAALSLFDLATERQDLDSAFDAAYRTFLGLSSFAATSEFEAMLEIRRGNDDQLAGAVGRLSELGPERGREADRSLALGWFLLRDRRSIDLISQLLAERLRDEARAGRPLTGFLAELLASALQQLGSTPKGLETLDAARRFASAADRKLARKILTSVARLLGAWMRPEAAGTLVQALPAENDPELELMLLLASAKTQPALALEALESFESQIDRQRHLPLLAETLVHKARLHILMADLGAAIEALSSAARIFDRVGNTAWAANCALTQARYLLHHHGDLEQARQALERRLRSLEGRGIPERLLQFEIAARTNGDTSEAEGLLKTAEVSSIPLDRLSCAMTLLALLPGERRRVLLSRIVELLISTFELLPDLLARSNYPWMLRDLRITLELEPQQEKRLLGQLHFKNFPPIFGCAASVTDRAWAFLAHAHFLRLFGRMDRAISGIRDARDIFLRCESLTGLREVWHLEALGQTRPNPDEFAKLRGKAPNLDLLIAIEQAEHAFVRQDPQAAQRWLQGVRLGQPALQWTGLAARAERVFTRLKSRIFKGLSGLETQSPWIGGINLGWHGPSQGTDREAAEAIWSPYPWLIFDVGGAGRRPVETWIGSLTAFAQKDQPVYLDPNELADGYRAAPYGLVAAISRRPEIFAGEVALEVFKSLLANHETFAIDLAIVGNHLSGLGVPWELARRSAFGREKSPIRLLYRQTANQPYRISWLQNALREQGVAAVEISGKWDRLTASALRQLANRLGTEDVGKWKKELRQVVARSRSTTSPRVVILQPPEHQQMSSQRGFEAAGGGNRLQRIYEYRGFRCETLWGVDLEDFLRGLKDREPPTLLHVYASYSERKSEGVVVPDLGERRAAFDQASTQEGREGRARFCPLLILDGPGEPEPVEQVRQIFLRNAAATLLARNPFFPNILGLGLDPHPNVETLETLLEGVLKGESLEEIYAAISTTMPKLDSESLVEDSGRLAPALWSADPDLNLIF